MASQYERFWSYRTYAVVGHTAKSPFPKLTYEGLKGRGKTVFAVDPSIERIDGDAAYASLAMLPVPVDAVVLEVPRDETAQWVSQVAAAGVPRVWIHMKRDTPEALALARSSDLEVCSGTCAVMYLKGGFHSIHKWINQLMGKY